MLFLTVLSTYSLLPDKLSDSTMNQVTRTSLPDERTKYFYQILLHQNFFVANKIKLSLINLKDNFSSQ
jgi:hypothetical protein